MKIILLTGIALLSIMATPLQSAESITVGEILQRCKTSYAGVNDYTCVLHRKDLVNGELKEHSNVIFKFKKPSRYYMKWEKDKIEAIYAEGKYDNKMVIHGGLLFKYLSLAVKPEAALKYNRHTIREADIGHIINLFEENYSKAMNDKDTIIEIEGEETLDSRTVWRLKAVFPADSGYYGHVIFINIDKGLYLPIKITVYGWNMELLEQYYYEDLKVNVGLTEKDFDVDNSRYSFNLGSL